MRYRDGVVLVCRAGAVEEPKRRNTSTSSRSSNSSNRYDVE